MANQEQLDVLKQGVEAWNRWREENPDIWPDLSGAFLHKANLNGADLHGAYLDGTDLREANLNGANLNRSSMSYMNLHMANFRDANLRDANLRDAYLRGAVFTGADLSNADLSDGIFSGSFFNGANLSWANLHKAVFIGVTFHQGGNLSGADLSNADLSEANLHGVNLSGANLSNANLSWAYLRETNLSSTDLNQANLFSANLGGANLSNSNLSNANVWYTEFSNIDLSMTKGLDTLHHQGPSYVDIKTVVLPKGDLFKSFLRGTGFPDTFIDYLPSLLNTPIQYQSCFISYSSKDNMFAQRLYADLQGHGVRCWFAPHNMRIGDKIRSRIDEAIHQHEKLLLLLSEHAVASTWVEDEVETAFEKEQRQQREVLLPVRLDEQVMQTSAAWAAKLRRTRHIGDFTRWTDPQAYQSAFERLLRDLKAEDSKPKE